jgi:hypothetical protein
MGFLFLLPGTASVVMFILLCTGGVLARPKLVGTCCATGLVLQFSGSGSGGVWLAGLLINVGMAMYLSVRLMLS